MSCWLADKNPGHCQQGNCCSLNCEIFVCSTGISSATTNRDILGEHLHGLPRWVTDKSPVDWTGPFACRCWPRKSLLNKQRFCSSKNNNFLVDNEQGFCRQVNKTFPIRRKDKICLVVSLKFFNSVSRKRYNRELKSAPAYLCILPP